ncbi:MAG: hypothetical protein AB7U73_14290 [Pirellulales bacterium]
MNIPLEVKQALDQAHGAPIELVDDESNARYVLIRAEVFERLKVIFDDSEPSEKEKAADLASWAERTGYFDPAMDAYDNYLPPQS